MKAVIFDLDGTLVHSAPDLHAAANAMLADLGAGAVTLDQVTSFIGNGVPKLVERCLAATGSDAAPTEALSSFTAHYGRAPTALTQPYPGVETMLQTLQSRGIAMGICTNKPAANTDQVLSNLGMAGYFAAVVGGDTLPQHKPDPAVLHHCLDLLGVDLADAFYVGDSETDAATAANAGIRFALFSGGYRKTRVEDMAADIRFDHFDQLIAALDR